MDKQRLSKRLEIAANNTHRKYNNFQGIALFGSFVNPKIKHPNDIDFIPVLDSYEGCWGFSTDDEGDFDEHYNDYEEMETFFGDHFTEFQEGYDVMFKTYRRKNGLFHVESLVALDNLPRLKKRLDYYSAKPDNFIGTKEAEAEILEFYKCLSIIQTSENRNI